MDLKSKLQEYQKTNDRNIEKEADALLASMLENIGNPDPELRDKLIYSTLYHWVNNDIFSDESLRKLLTASIKGDFLFYKIGERNTDSVFTRSFSSLAAALVLEKDSNKRTMPEELISYAINKAILYLKEERDTRGYVQGKGWAHSIAHGADLLAAAVGHPSFNQDSIDHCMDAITACYEKEAVYIDDEEERLICVIEALLEKGMTEEKLDGWVRSLNADLVANFQQKGFSVALFRRKKNRLDLMKALYFRLELLGSYNEVQETIKGLLKDWHTAIYKPS